MAFEKNRPVIAGVLYDANGNLIDVTLDGSIRRLETLSRLSDGALNSDLAVDENGKNRLLVEGFGESKLQNIVVADFYKAAIAGSAVADYIAIDLNNRGSVGGAVGDGPYLHDEVGTGIKIRGFSAQIIKEMVKDPWNVKFGVLTRVGISDGDVYWFQLGAIHGTDSSRAVQRIDSPIPLELNLTVVTNALTKLVASQKSLADAAFQSTGLPLSDIAGNSIDPEVGDIVIRVTPEEANDTAIINYCFWYAAE